MPTETWNIGPNIYNSTKMIDPVLHSNADAYYYGELFLLSPYYCKRSGKILNFKISNISQTHFRMYWNNINRCFRSILYRNHATQQQ